MKKTLKIGFDVDDTLIPFTQAILDECEKKFKHSFPYEEVVWGFSNYKPEETEFVHQLFRDRDFIGSIPMFDGTIALLNECHERGHEIFFVTSTYSNVMTTRALYLFEKIPFIHPRNYIMTGRKDVVKLDMHFDDCMDHIQKSIADIPVLVNTPWNKGIPGYIRVEPPIDSPDTYLNIINMAEEGMSKQEIYKTLNPHVENDGPYIIVIVGGSGVGKTVVTQSIMEKSDDFEKVVTNTTRNPRDGEKDGVDYNFCSKKTFKELIATNSLLEYTEYAGNYYGTSKYSVKNILKKGKNAIAVMDIDGARNMKKCYPMNTYSIFLTREKEGLIRSILERNVPMEEKIKRISQLDTDFSGSSKCDYLIVNKDIDGTADDIINLFTKRS